MEKQPNKIKIDMKSKLVKENLNEKFGLNDWLLSEISGTMEAYGLSEIEIDKILNDPDIVNLVIELLPQMESSKDIELLTLKVMQYADDEGILSNEWPPQKPTGAAYESEEMSPADKGFEAARKDNLSPEQQLDDMFESLTSATNLLENLDFDIVEDGGEVSQIMYNVINNLYEVIEIVDGELRKTGYDRHK